MPLQILQFECHSACMGIKLICYNLVTISHSACGRVCGGVCGGGVCGVECVGECVDECVGSV